MIPWQADCTMKVPKTGLDYWNVRCQKSVGEEFICKFQCFVAEKNIPYEHLFFAVMKTQSEQFNYVDGKQKEAIIHTSGRQNAVDTISLSLPIPRNSLEVSLGAISPTSPSNVAVELLARLLNNNTNA